MLDPNVAYIRTDGALIGTGAEVSRLSVRTSPWLTVDGTFNDDPFEQAVWSATFSPDERVQDAGNDCDDWQSGSPDVFGILADYGTGGPRWYNSVAQFSCDRALGLYCVEYSFDNRRNALVPRGNLFRKRLHSAASAIQATPLGFVWLFRGRRERQSQG